ncbi:MAG TPA: SDR family NAD(P)-dependent oxidoreductase [Candidatus Solibacter sp.]|nr:SDR family NAD(P)-dependent oxidoreductase [Candidatus Solibacter sp.]
MKLDGRTALITGAGSGLGKAIASLFAREGARVIINDVNRDAAQAVVASLGSASERSSAIAADVSDSAAVRAMFAQVKERFGGLDILVNNAGIGETGSRRDEINRKGEAQLGELMSGRKIESHWDVTVSLSDEEWDRMIGVHLTGTFYCTREALKLMSAKNRGSIINMSSVAGLHGIPIAAHYGAAKGGILGFTRSVAQEMGSRGIRVNAICPGWIETPMTENFSPLLKASLTARVPLARWGQPEEVAATALFLASDEGSYFTGQWLSPNGGLFIA